MTLLKIEYNFCPQCGHTLSKALISGCLREQCPACSFVHWGEFSLGVGGVLWRDGKVLLVQRAHNPGQGAWTIPGGYVDQDEKAAEAAAREIREETGVNSEAVSLIAVRDRPGNKHDAYLVFLMRDLGGEPRSDEEEVSGVGFFTLEECRELNVATLTLSVLQASLKAKEGLCKVEGIKLIGNQSELYQV